MRKYLLSILILCCGIVVTAQKSEKIKISGSAKNNKGAKIVLEYFDFHNNPKIDSVDIDKSGNFKIVSNINTYGFYRLLSGDSKILLVLKPGEDIKIDVDFNEAFGLLKSKGSDEISQMIEFKKTEDDYKAILDSIYNLFQSYNNQGITEHNLSLQENFAKTEKEKFDAFAEIIKSKPNLLSNLIFVEHLPFANYFWAYDTVCTSLKDNFSDNIFFKELQKKIIPEKHINIGQVAPDIALADTNGNIVKLSSLRGKYVLIDFWASWCGPCRRENPNLVNVYNKYKDKGFEIYAVSLDRSRDGWINAIHKDNLTWFHVSDLKYWESEAAALYGVKGIPFTVLLDPEGKIMNKGIRSQELDLILESVLK